MVRLIPRSQTLENLKGLFLGWLSNDHLRKASLKGGILLHMLSVLVKRGRTNALDLAARERWLQDVCGINRALCGPCANERMKLINKEDRVS